MILDGAVIVFSSFFGYLIGRCVFETFAKSSFNAWFLILIIIEFLLYVFIRPKYDFGDRPISARSFEDGWLFVLLDNLFLVSGGVILAIVHIVYLEWRENINSEVATDTKKAKSQKTRPSELPHHLGPWRRNDQFADEELDLRAQTLIRLMGLTFPTLNRNLIAALERELELSRTQKKPALELLQRSRDEQTRVAELRSSVERLPGGGYDILRFAMRGVCNIAVTAGQNTPEMHARLSNIAAQLGLHGR